MPSNLKFESTLVGLIDQLSPDPDEYTSKTYLRKGTMVYPLKAISNLYAFSVFRGRYIHSPYPLGNPTVAHRMRVALYRQRRADDSFYRTELRRYKAIIFHTPIREWHGFMFFIERDEKNLQKL